MSSPAVLIVGSGPSGLATALALLQNGISVRIINKETVPRVGQRGFGIQPRILEAHKLLGTLPNIEKIGRAPQPVRIYELPGGTKPVKTFDMVEIGKPTTAVPRPNVLMVGQELQERVLREHIENNFSAKVEFGTEIVAVEQYPNNVSVTLKKVDTNEEEKATFKWLVGADGAHSVVRKGLGLSFLGETRASENMVTGDVHIKKGLDRDFWHTWGEPAKKFLVLRPFETQDDCFNFAVAGAELDVAKTASSPEELIKSFYEISERKDLEFGDLIWFAHWRPNIRMANKFGQDRGFIVGDAAHVHSPTGGQGMNSSVLDAINLAWKLALVEKGLSPPSLLESYTHERLPVIASMLNKTTALLNKLYKSGGDNMSGFLRGHDLKMLGVTYRGSPIVVDGISPDEPVDPYRSGEDGKLCAGDRAPDASVGLHDLFGTAWHTVLVFEGATMDTPQGILKVVKEGFKAPVKTVLVLPKEQSSLPDVKADHILQDIDGSAFENYKVSGQDGGLFIIRPDGAIGARVDGVEGLTKYLKLVFI